MGGVPLDSHDIYPYLYVKDLATKESWIIGFLILASPRSTILLNGSEKTLRRLKKGPILPS